MVGIGCEMEMKAERSRELVELSPLPTLSNGKICLPGEFQDKLNHESPLDHLSPNVVVIVST